MRAADSFDFNTYDYVDTIAFGFVDADNIRLGMSSALTKCGVTEADQLYVDLGRLIQKAALNRYYVYSAVAPGSSPPEWIANLRSLPRFVFRPALLKETGKKRKQEGVDVRLAVEAMQNAHRGNMKACTVFSGDGDLLPLVNALIDEGIHTTVASFHDPTKTDVAARLRDAADNYVHIGPQIMADSLASEVCKTNSGSGSSKSILKGCTEQTMQIGARKLKFFLESNGSAILPKSDPSNAIFNYEKFRSVVGARIKAHLLSERFLFVEGT